MCRGGQTGALTGGTDPRPVLQGSLALGKEAEKGTAPLSTWVQKLTEVSFLLLRT